MDGQNMRSAQKSEKKMDSQALTRPLHALLLLLLAFVIACGGHQQRKQRVEPEPYHGCGIQSTAENPEPCGKTAGQINPNQDPEVGAKPRLADLAEKSVSEQCQLLLPRLRGCTDALIVQHTRSMGKGDLADLVQDSLAEVGSECPDRDVMTICERKIPGSTYFSSVVRCWDESTCELFAACVYPNPVLEPTTSKLDRLVVGTPT